MTRHVYGVVKPWEWDTVPLDWIDWVQVSMAVDADLNTPAEKTDG